MSDKPLPVSVVICAYNAEHYLGRSLQSICQQTYRDLEILVIDDASADNTASLAFAMADKDNRIRVIRLDRNEGIAHARQVGLETVRHEWLLFLDADDIALPNMIEKQVEVLLSDPKIIGVSTYSSFFSDDEGHIIAEQRVGIKSKEEFFEKYEKQKLIFLLPNTLFSKRHAMAAGGYRLEGFPPGSDVRYQDFSEDVDLWCRLSDFGANGEYLLSIPTPLFLYRKTANSLSTKNVFRMQEKMRWIKDCLQHRRLNVPERSLEEYRKSLSLYQRIDDFRSDCAAFAYKKAGFQYLHGQYLLASILLALVGIIDPHFMIKKIKTQKRPLKHVA